MKNKNPKNNIIKTSHNLPYARILFIDKMISEGNFPSAPKIAREYEYQYRGTPFIKALKIFSFFFDSNEHAGRSKKATYFFN